MDIKAINDQYEERLAIRIIDGKQPATQAIRGAEDEIIKDYGLKVFRQLKIFIRENRENS